MLENAVVPRLSQIPQARPQRSAVNIIFGIEQFTANQFESDNLAIEVMRCATGRFHLQRERLAQQRPDIQHIGLGNQLDIELKQFRQSGLPFHAFELQHFGHGCMRNDGPVL